MGGIPPTSRGIVGKNWSTWIKLEKLVTYIWRYWVDKFGRVVLYLFHCMVKNIRSYGFYLLGRPVLVLWASLFLNNNITTDF